MKIANLPKMMRAVRLRGIGFDNITLEEIPLPQPNDDQLLVRVEAAGVCTSLLKLVAQGNEHTLLNGWDITKYPIILGDEGCVTIVSAGRNVADRYPLGQRYATQPAVDSPPINYRQRYRKNGEGVFKVAVGYTLPGHLAEYMLIPEEVIRADCLLPLPSDNIPCFAGALCEPLSCVISAQAHHVHLKQESPSSPRLPCLGLKQGGVTMVIGSGPMGCMHAEAALRFRPRHLVVVDIVKRRLDWVRRVLQSRAQDVGTELHPVLSPASKELLDRISQGKGADDIIVAVGCREVQMEAQQWLARDGVLNLFGGLKREEAVIDLDTLRVHYDEIKIVGSSGGTPTDVAEALRMVANKEFKPGEHLAIVGSLEQFPRALEMVKNQETEGKIVLYPQIGQTPLQPVKDWGWQEEKTFLEERKG
jgi:L-iditol 2-dehydrogenase